jgi:hypothetical protein
MEDLIRQFEALKESVAEAEAHFEKFANKNVKQAGTRLRGSMQQVATLAKEIRKSVQEAKGSM